MTDASATKEPGSGGTEESASAASSAPSVPLFLVKGEATAEEVAALTAVLTALGNAGAEKPARPTPVWAAPQRAARTPHLHGPGGWRASSLPR